MKRKFKKSLALALAFLLTGVLQVGAALAAELVATEMFAEVPNGEITVVQGKSISFMVKLSIDNNENLEGYTLENPARVTLNTLYTFNGGTWTSSTPIGVDQYGNELKFYDGGTNSYYVSITVSVSKYALPGRYSTNIRKTIINPNSGILQNNLLNDQFHDPMVISVVQADTIPPVVNISSPISGAYYNADNLPKFEFTARDDQDGYGIVIYNGGFHTEEGVHTANVVATDTSYNTTTKSVTYTIDKTAPEITINYPVEGDHYSDTTRLHDNDITIKDVNLDQSKTIIKETGIGDGKHILTVTAYDKAGNFTTKSVRFTMDSTNPVVVINNPGNGTYHKSETLPEVVEYTVIDDNNVSTEVTGYVTDREGENTVTAIATDLAGNIGNASSTYIVDNHAPVISLNSLSQRYYKSDELPNLNLNVSDVYDPDPNYNTPVIEKTSGLHSYTITAFDQAGNNSSKEIEYYIDDEAPTLTITSPIRDRLYDSSNSYLSLEYETEDNSGVDPRVTINIDGQLSSDRLLPTTKGEHTVVVTSTDAAGNSTIKEVTYILDNTPPEIELSQSLDVDSWTNEDINIEAAIMDYDSGVTVKKWAQGTRDVGYFAISGIDFTNNTFSVLDNGIYTVYAKDAMENESVETIEIKNIDRLAPLISGVKAREPNDKGWYNTDVAVQYTYSDDLSGIKDGTDSKEDIITVEGQNLTSSCIVYDKAGNSASDSVTGIKIDKTKPVITLNGTDYTTDEIIDLGDIVIGSPAIAWRAFDSLSGLTTSDTGTIEFNKQNTHTIPIVATDNAGNTTTVIVKYRVVYSFGGMLQPINANGNSVFKAGSTVPVKFKLNNINGGFVTSAVATIYYAKYSDNILGNEIEAVSTNSATIGNIFRYDITSNQYIFNLSTKVLTDGTYQLTILLDDGKSYIVRIGLK